MGMDIKRSSRAFAIDAEFLRLKFILCAYASESIVRIACSNT